MVGRVLLCRAVVARVVGSGFVSEGALDEGHDTVPSVWWLWILIDHGACRYLHVRGKGLDRHVYFHVLEVAFVHGLVEDVGTEPFVGSDEGQHVVSVRDVLVLGSNVCPSASFDGLSHSLFHVVSLVKVVMYQ